MSHRGGLNQRSQL